MHKNSQNQRNLSLYFKFNGKSKLNVPNIMFTVPLRTVCRTWPAAGCTWLRGPWPSSTTPTRGQYTSSTTYSSTRYSCSQCIAAHPVYKQYYILFDQVQQFSEYSCTAHLQAVLLYILFDQVHQFSEYSCTACLQAVLHTLRSGTAVLRV